MQLQGDSFEYIVVQPTENWYLRNIISRKIPCCRKLVHNYLSVATLQNIYLCQGPLDPDKNVQLLAMFGDMILECKAQGQTALGLSALRPGWLWID